MYDKQDPRNDLIGLAIDELIEILHTTEPNPLIVKEKIQKALSLFSSAGIYKSREKWWESKKELDGC